MELIRLDSILLTHNFCLNDVLSYLEHELLAKLAIRNNLTSEQDARFALPSNLLTMVVFNSTTRVELFWKYAAIFPE